jgi:hypothetical protein
MAQNGNTETYRRVSGVIKREVGTTTFLVDTRLDAIHQLDPMGAAVWEQLAEPTSCGELAETLHLAFPDVDCGVIERDLGALFDGLLNAKLIARAS